MQGNEPSLPQANHDDAPMISGRGTKIIAEARGAYLAGNFSGLIEALYTDQYLRLHPEIVRGAVTHMRGILSCDDASPHTAEFIEAAERWLLNPTTETVERMRELEEQVTESHPADYTAVDAILSYFTWCVTVGSVIDASEWALRVAEISAIMQYRGELTQEVVDQLHIINVSRIKQWHLDVVWAILRGAAIPPAPNLVIDLEVSA